MDTEVWPGDALSSSVSRDRFPLRPDDTDSSESLSDSSSEQSSEEDEAPEMVTPRDKGKPRKRVTFQTDENLVEIFEIPARGQDLFDEICDVIEQSPPPQNSVVYQEPEADLKISGHAAGFSVGEPSDKSTKDELPERLSRPERPDRAVLNRRNTDVWGTYTVTHANTPVKNSGVNPPIKQQKSTPSQYKPRVTSNTIRNVSSAESKTPPVPPPKPPVPVQRKNLRVRSAGKAKKKGAKSVKDSKNSSAYDNTLSQDENDGEKLIAMFLEKNANKEDNDVSPAVKNPKPKSAKKGTYRRSTSSARNREKEMINKEMKGEVQRRVFKTYNNISSLHRPGQRQVNRGQNQGETKNGSDKGRCRSANKHSLSVDSGKLNSGPKVKVGKARQGSADSSANGEADNRDVSFKNDTQQQSKGKHDIPGGLEESDRPTSKSNGFIFPEEKTFHFPLMSQPKETTSQLVRLDSNMLSLYKKKLYAWHMANGTVVEGRMETPCISPMWEPLKPSYS